MKRKIALLLLWTTPLMWGCTSTFTGLRSNQDHLFEELKTEIADLKHALHGTDVELKLLEERVETQETVSTKGDIAALQRKLSGLEKTIDKLNGDIRSLMTYANQTTSSLSQFQAQYRDQILAIDKKFDEVAKLRSTLTQMSNVHSTSESSSQAYLVKAGDSLEKIARKFHVSVEALKRDNQLLTDKIVIGQELAIPPSE
jgi:LysM repeat protein